MPVAVQITELAASPGADKKRDAARRSVASEFFQRHLYEAEPEDRRDWSLVTRALQTVDFSRPVVLGPMPAAPRRLAAPPRPGPLGPGFFAADPPDSGEAQWWLVSPEAIYMKYAAPALASSERTAPVPEPIRYFIPGARGGRDSALAWRDRAR